MNMPTSHLAAKVVRLGRAWRLTAAALSAAPAIAQVTEFLDAPGPGYRTQSGRLPETRIERLELPRHPVRPALPGSAEAWFLRIHPALKKEWDAWQVEREKSSFEEEFRRFTHPHSFSPFPPVHRR